MFGALKKIRQTLSRKRNSGKDSEPLGRCLYNLNLSTALHLPSLPSSPSPDQEQDRSRAKRRNLLLGAFYQVKLCEVEALLPTNLFLSPSQGTPSLQETRSVSIIPCKAVEGLQDTDLKLKGAETSWTLWKDQGGREDDSLPVTASSSCGHGQKQAGN